MMKTRCALWLAMVLATAGCRTADPSVDLLEGELRWLEDQLYMAEDEYRLKCAQLASCRRENDALRKEANQASRGATLSPLDDEPSRPDQSPSRPVPTEEIPELRIPNVEPGEPVEPRIELPGPDALRVDPALKTTSATSVGPMDDRVTHIVLNPRLTGGYNFDQWPGDEGLMVVVETRNADGQYVEFSGPVSVVVLDPSKTGPDARVARWDFDATEVAALTGRSLLGQGIHLELPWPNQPPDRGRLRVFVRYTTADGRQLQADRQVDVDPPASHLGGWTPASRSAGYGSKSDTLVAASRARAKAESGALGGSDATNLLTPKPSPIAPNPTALLPHHADTVHSGEDATISPAELSSAATGSSPSRVARPTWRPYR